MTTVGRVGAAAPRVPICVPTDADARARLAARVAALATDAGRSVAAAESLTGGMVAQALAAAEGAGTWFRGSLVAYSGEVKHDLLDVPPGPVVSATAAGTMARTVRRLLGADVAVAVTGSGGPQAQDGRDPGTVFVAVDGPGAGHRVLRLEIERAEPAEVCAEAAAAALGALAEALTAGA